MTERLDLLKIAQAEQSGDLFKLLDSIYQRSKVQPRGISDAVIWEGGSTHGNVKPVAHAFTDMFVATATYNCTGTCAWFFGSAGGQTALNARPAPVLGSPTR